MDARRPETQTDSDMVLRTPATTAQTPAKPKRERGVTTDGVKAGQLFEKLVALDEEEQAELAASPSDIRAKFEQRRSRALAEASDDVRKLVDKLRAP